MFFFWILLVILVVIGASVLIGRAINNRDSGRHLSNQEKVTMAKVSGAFPHRKESNE